MFNFMDMDDDSDKLESSTSKPYTYNYTTTIEDDEFKVILKPSLGLTNNTFHFRGDYKIKKRCLFCYDKNGYVLYTIPLDNIVKIIDLTNLGEK